MSNEPKGPLTNKHLRWMAWAAFVAAIALAVWGVASDSVIMAFLTQAVANLGLVQGRNATEEIVDGNVRKAREANKSSVDVSKV